MIISKPAFDVILHLINYWRMDEHPVILFDGICNLCNASVQFVIRRDPGGIFKFATLQGDPGKKMAETFGLDGLKGDSFILIENGKAYTRSAAALRVARKLKGPVSLLYGFIIVPPFIRNGVYDLISRNRYKWFGKKEGVVQGVKISTAKDVHHDVDTVTLYLNPAHQKQYYDYILSLNPKRIIFNPGTENRELASLAKNNGIETLQACTLVMLSTGQY